MVACKTSDLPAGIPPPAYRDSRDATAPETAFHCCRHCHIDRATLCRRNRSCRSQACHLPTCLPNNPATSDRDLWEVLVRLSILRERPAVPETASAVCREH